MENEIWKDIYYTDLKTGETVDFRGKYQISNFGRVKSLERSVKNGNGNRRVNERILKKQLDKNGYEVIWLGEMRLFKVHRLVAYMFLQIDDNKKNQINHKDENKSNNHVDNLEWCDSKYNNNYGNHNIHVSKSVSKPVLGFKFEHNEDYFFLDCVWSSGGTKLENKTNRQFKHQGINYCTTGKRKTYKGYKFCNFDLVNYLNESEERSK